MSEFQTSRHASPRTLPPIMDAARTSERTARPPGWVLMLCSCLPVLGAVLLAPLLPAIQRAFPEAAESELLTLIVLTAPALTIGLTAPVAGRLIQRFGRKRLLLWALVLYAPVGTAPLLLPTLPSIVASRALLGVTEAVIMTSATTLLTDYFRGRRRDHYFGLQTVCTTAAATVFFALGGLLGAQDWRTPFWLYAVSLPIAVAVAVVVRPPSTRALPKAPPLQWSRVGTPLAVTLAGGLVFYVLIAQLPYLLIDVGIDSTTTIGGISAVSSLATAISALLFGWLARFGPVVAIPFGFCLSGLGIAGLSLAAWPWLVVTSAVVTGFGNGLLLPGMLSWTLGTLRSDQNAVGIGLWTALLFTGQFACALVLHALPNDAYAGMSPALFTIGIASLLIGIVCVATAPDGTEPTADAVRPDHRGR